jgi:maltose alpha-D-glucosyltransferase/alpha-amylase
MSDAGSLFHSIRRMIQIRREHPAFGRGSMEWIDTGNPSLAAYQRTYHDQSILIIQNLSGSSQNFSFPAGSNATYTELFTKQGLQLRHPLMLQPYSYLWLEKN